MAGMEQLEIHSKSYLVRWIHVPVGNTISWSIQPQKRSLNFGIFKHPGGNLAASIQTVSTLDDNPPLTPGLEGTGTNKSTSRKENTQVLEVLQGKGLKPVSWYGNCEADKVSMGTFDVLDGEGGMYGLVFDNTFSKQQSKTAMFVLMTYPTSVPPKSGNTLLPSHSLGQRSGSTSSLGARTPVLRGESTESLSQDGAKARSQQSADGRINLERNNSTSPTVFSGILSKKRRKRNQGYARRFFSLDYTSSTLSYYQNKQSSALRGSVPLSLAALSTNDKRREISVDSGTEVWHLRATSQKDYDAWTDALERAARASASAMSPAGRPVPSGTSRKVDPEEELEWNRVEQLVSRAVGIRDSVCRLAKNTDPRYLPFNSGLGISGGHRASPAAVDTPEPTEYFGKEALAVPEKTSFWRRRASKEVTSPAAMFRKSMSTQLAVPSPIVVSPAPNGSTSVAKRGDRASISNESVEGIHESCMAIFKDLDALVAQFSELISQSRSRRHPPVARSKSRQSMESQSDDEFFDANDGIGGVGRSQTFTIQDSSDSEVEQSGDVSDAESISSSELSLARGPSLDRKGRTSTDVGLWPGRPKSLTPLPLDSPVPRRRLVPPAKGGPPSLIGVLRKNVGKDMSTIAMPVTMNEPTSILQRSAEQLEYSELLNAAASSQDPTERLLYIAAFAISGLSSNRVKERAIRKPFNAMLGETFELVREDKGFRLMSEKISHRPIVLALQAEHEDWTLLQNPAPQSKFWGKSVEVNTDGRVRIFLHTGSVEELYSYTQATSFLRNIIAGEKYIEPVQTMTIVNEASGAKAVCTFKAGGMFAGRSEDVTVQAFDARGEPADRGLVGKWTTRLNWTAHGADSGDAAWSAGPLVDNVSQRYGFTQFAASLNELTSVEQGRVPATDCRLRPDQRALEDLELEKAEALKVRLEEGQRQRRKAMEDGGEQWLPRWFIKAGTVDGGEEIWRLKTGKDGYWEERAAGRFTGVTEVFGL